jgi:hypothetical protein
VPKKQKTKAKHGADLQKAIAKNVARDEANTWKSRIENKGLLVTAT